jgi:large subunit ribosomal protein L25
MNKAKITLKGEKREELGKKNKVLRMRGMVPAVVYGRKLSPINISINLAEFRKKVLLSDARENLIFNLEVNDKEKNKSLPVKTHQIQRNPLSDDIIHLDLINIDMEEKIKTKVRIILKGTSIGVKEEAGVLIHNLREVEIKCLPGDIPDVFEVDISPLKLNDSLHVSDLKLFKNVEILAEQSELVVSVVPPAKEEEVAAPSPEEVLAAAGEAKATEEVAEEKVKEKAPPGAPPAEG